MSRKKQRVYYTLDPKGIKDLPFNEIKAILRGADELIATGGRSLLAKILKGSRDKKLLQYGLDQCPVYGFYKELKVEDITARIDWLIKKGYLDIEYSGRLPVIVYTERGWEIERDTYSDELLEKLGLLIPGGDYSYVNELKDRNRGMILLLLATYFWDLGNYPPRKVYGFPTREDLERYQYIREYRKPLADELINVHIAGRDYQIRAIRTVMEAIEKKQRKFLLVMATGTGKTRTCIALADALMRAGWVERVLFLVDRIALREQGLATFKEYLPNEPIWPKLGEKSISKNRRVYVSTYPTMLNDYPHITEDLLRTVYKNRKAKFIQFIRHILGIEILESFPETVAKAFDQFIREHSHLNIQQLNFLDLLRDYILERETIQKRDLIQAPCTIIHPRGIRGLFSPAEIDEIVKLTERLVA